LSWEVPSQAGVCARYRGGGNTELPPGPDRDLVAEVCQSCHDLQMVFDASGISRQEWDMSLDEQAANGMNISDGDRAKILADLSTYLRPSPPKATNAH
jgi:hypothetical protein